MIPYLSTTMQFADVSFALLQILPDGKAFCSELMLHHAMQCMGASCRMLQIPSNFAADITQLRDSNSKRPTYGTRILSHRGAFTKTCLHTCIYTYTCFYPGMVLHANTFMHRCFYTGMLLYMQKNFCTQTRGVLVHTDASTQRCFYRGVLLHAREFTQGFF